MVYRTHTAFSGSLTLLPVFLPKEYNPFIGLPLEVFFAGFFIIVLTSLMPDLDEPESYLSKKFPFFVVSHILAIFTNHRGITHNFIFSIVFFALIYIGTIIYHSYEYFHILFFMGLISYIGHILGDSMTIGGIKRAFYPLSKSTFWLVPKFLRFKTNSLFEHVLFIIFFLVFAFEIFNFLNINEYISQYLNIKTLKYSLFIELS